MEIRPGIWCPKEIALTVYDPKRLREQGVQQLAWTQTYYAEAVDLSPHYPRKYFSDVPIPDGVKVYNLDSTGKITSKFTQGHPELSAGNAPAATRERSAAGLGWLPSTCWDFRFCWQCWFAGRGAKRL